MKTDIQNTGFSRESYVVEIDGKIRSAYGIFVEALKAGMELKQKFPHSRIKVHDVDETCKTTSRPRTRSAGSALRASRIATPLI